MIIYTALSPRYHLVIVNYALTFGTPIEAFKFTEYFQLEGHTNCRLMLFITYYVFCTISSVQFSLNHFANSSLFLNDQSATKNYKSVYEVTNSSIIRLRFITYFLARYINAPFLHRGWMKTFSENLQMLHDTFPPFLELINSSIIQMSFVPYSLTRVTSATPFLNHKFAKKVD